MSSPPSAPQRLPRSLHESPNYNPAWRQLQVEEYLRYRRHLGDQDGLFILPSSERDSLVRAYFKFRSGVVSPKHAAFIYAHDCEEANGRTSMASRIKALTVAEVNPAEIAERLHTSVENIEMFQKLFFDVAAYVVDRTTLGAILQPLTDASSATDPRERVWLLAALHLGRKGLDYVVDQRVQLSQEEQQEISDSIHAILAGQTLRYSLSLQGKPEAGPEVMEAYQKSMEARLRNPPPGNSKEIAFSTALGKICKENLRNGSFRVLGA